MTLAVLAFGQIASAQTIIGKWQLIKESTCLESSLAAASGDEEEMVRELKNLSGPTPKIMEIGDRQIGAESVRILSRRKDVSRRQFYYKFDGERLLILDKKSQTLTDSFTVETLSSDSLIVSNSSRPCETRVFLKIK